MLRDKLPSGPLWQFEIKLDGYRIQAHANAGDVRLYSKSGRDYSERLPAIREAVGALGRDVILDGEAVMLDGEGRPDFFPLHAAVAFGSAPGAILYAFDLLALDGDDLRPLPLSDRRAILAEALARPGSGIELSEHHVGDGPELLRAACETGLEGIVAKRVDKPYASGDRPEWVKVKCTTVESFAVIGFDPVGHAGVAALKLARLGQNGALVSCGSVGSGIGETASRELRRALDAGAHVVGDVEHRGVTPAGELRHPVFKGWHEEAAQ